MPALRVQIPQVLNYLGAAINYGGRVTDDKDKPSNDNYRNIAVY